jgi:hypothetical protein
MMDDKPAQRKAVKAGNAPKGMDIKAKLKKQAEKSRDDDAPTEPAKKKGK